MLKGEILFNWVNPIRAGQVERPEDYRWNSLGYHIQTDNKDNFLSLDFWLKEFGVFDPEERLKGYRRYVYEAGALNHPGKGHVPEEYAPLSQGHSTGQAGVIDNDKVEHERKNNFKFNRMHRFRYRARYFTDSGIIDTKEFVSNNYRRFKDLFMSNNGRRYPGGLQVWMKFIR